MHIQSENEFLSLSKKGKNDWWRILLFVLTLIALPALASLTVDSIDLPGFEDQESELISDIVIEGISFLIVLIGVAIAISLIHKRTFSTLNGHFKIKEFLEGVAVWGVLIVIGSFLNEREQWDYFADNALNSSLIYILPIAILAIGIQSYTEEVVFRGYLLQTLSLRVKNISLLIFIGSLLFGVLHIADGLDAAIGITIYGCLCCYIALTRNNLAFVAGVHLINNLLFVYVLDDRNAGENTDFLKFDLMEFALFMGQCVLLFAYIRLKELKSKRNLAY